MIRTPAIDRKISEIHDDDKCVSVIATVVSNNPREYTMLLDDGTGQVTAFVERLYNVGKVIRVIGRPFENGKGINADIVQDFSDVDLSLYKKLLEWEERR
ncbi:MAG: replication protein RepA [Candidatus Methanofastidiosa archaeon]|nr:replication protein RepA [Candidatus Methanofastidiosa archaeon]